MKTKEFCPAYLHSSVTVLHSVAFLAPQALGSFQKLVEILQYYKEKWNRTFVCLYYDLCWESGPLSSMRFISHVPAEVNVAGNGDLSTIGS